MQKVIKEEFLLISSNRLCIIAFTCFFLLLAVLPAFANDGKSPLFVEVNKQRQLYTRVPASIVAFSKNDIQAQKLQSPSDISRVVPGFSFNDPFGRFNPAPSIRGLIQPGLGDDPSVGFFNDGLYLSGRSSINSLGFDLERIEVLKGPQNALYGRNAFGGAINAVSARPTSTPELSIDLLGGTKDRYEFTGVANGTLTDTVNGRVALYHKNKGAYYNNTANNNIDIGKEETSAARLSFDYVPHIGRSILFQGTVLQDNDSQPKGFLVTANCGRRTSDGQFRLYCGELPADGSPYAVNQVASEGGQGYDRTHTRASITWTEDLNDNLKWTTLAGGSIERSAFIRDDDYSATQAARAGIDTDRRDAQFETRFNAQTADAKWSGLLGFSGYYYANETQRIDQFYVSGQTTPGGAYTKNHTDTLGTFGSLSRYLGAGFTLTGDGRYQWEKKDILSSVRDLSGRQIDLSDSWTKFTPKVTLSWQDHQSELLTYGSVAQGYKTGGFNDRQNIFDSERVYGPEKNTTYELGLKNIRLHDTVALDIAGFYIDWKDQQVIAYSEAGVTNNFYLNNAAKTKVKGGDLALRWQPSSALNIGFNYSYADARYDSYNDPDLRNIIGFGPSGDVEGKRLPRYSPHQFSLTADYARPTGFKDWNYIASSQFGFQSQQYTDNSNTAKTANRTLLNLQAGIENPALSVTLWVDNALNEQDANVGIPWTDATAGFRRAWLVVPEDGTTGGLRLKAKF